MPNGTDIRALDRLAVRISVDLASTATADDLARPTPCAGWTLGDLLAHMTAQHLGFAAAARGNGGDLAVWRAHPLGDRAVEAYRASAEQVIAAFAEQQVLERPFHLAEFGSRSPFPAPQAIGFHFIDYVVHGWDVARTLGLRYAPPSELLEAALPIARLVPNDETRRAPGAPFRPAVVTSADADPLDRILAALGRSPHWPE